MVGLKPGTTLKGGKYNIVKTLGQGSFGITYLATTKVPLSGGLGKIEINVNVAIKEFFMGEFNSRSKDGSSVDGTNTSLVNKYRKKFHREAENLAKLKHTNIVKVLEVFDENYTTYYAMEYVEGESLDEYIKKKGRIPENEVLVQVHEIGTALKYMHDHQMLHLDLKPKNIMRNSEGHLLLIDFGLSKQYDQNGEPESSTTLGRGTPGYASIEQANYQQDGTFPATLDIYAFGASIYKMLTGTTPPLASDILDDGFPDSLFFKIGISAETTSVVKKAMNPIRRQRYQTVSELLADIDSTTIYSNRAKKTDFVASGKNVGESEFGAEWEINADVYDDPIIEALNRKHAYSRDDIKQYGISVFTFSPNNRFPIYYRGYTYNDDGVSINRLRSLSDIATILEDIKYDLHVKDTNPINIESYLRNNKEVLAASYNIVTYCSEADLLQLMNLLRRHPSSFGFYRIIQEMQLLPLCFDPIQDSHNAYEYQHLYCEVEKSGGVIEIVQTGFVEAKEDYLSETVVKKLSNFEGFAYLILGSIIQYHMGHIHHWDEDTVLLSMMPFAIKVEVWINGRYRDGFTLLQRNSIIPTSKTETIYDDNCSIVILFLGKRFSLDVKELFRYSPNSIEITVHIDTWIRIEYVLKDKEKKKEFTITQSELFNYEVE